MSRRLISREGCGTAATLAEMGVEKFYVKLKRAAAELIPSSSQV
jgi:hypothetical protein